jgi:hypothetical protein
MGMRFLLRCETVVSVEFNGGRKGEDGRVKFARQQLVGCRVSQPYTTTYGHSNTGYPPLSPKSPLGGEQTWW